MIVQNKILHGSIVTHLDGNKIGTKCSLCKLVIQSGGITRFQFHLTHINPFKNVRKCPNIPSEVKTEILEKDAVKKKKSKLIEIIRTKLRET